MPGRIEPSWQVECTDGDVVPVYAYCRKCDELLGILDTEGDIAVWEIEGEEIGDHVYCTECARESRWSEWLESTLDAIEQAADEGEWEFHRDRYSGGFNSRSRYYTLDRECSSCILGGDPQECDCETLKIRVSDHGTAHCTEDLSLAMEAGGDDHTLQIVQDRLRRPRR